MTVELVEVTGGEVQQMLEEASPLVKRAEAFLVTDEASCFEADKIADECTEREKRNRAKLEKSRSTTYAAYNAVLELIHTACDPYLKAREILDKKIYKWRAEERRRREVEAAKQREEERKRVEEERLRQAQAVADAGRPDLADKILDEKIVVAAPEPPKIESVSGTVLRENWQFDITDEAKVPREFLMADRVKIARVVKVMKGATKIPGVEVWDAGTVARRKT
jgi:hypothetical protein